jgi:hypothetical protein
MNKQDALKLMIQSMNDDNRQLCEMTNMSNDETEALIEKSQQSLQFMLSNIYDKLEAAGFIKS